MMNPDFRLPIVLAGLAGAIALPNQEAAAAPEKPNIILIFADDLGWWDIACQGNPVVETPNIDRLAAEGLRFTDAYAHPVCTPTRVSLITGQVPARVGMHAIDRPFLQPYGMLLEPANAFALNPRLTSLADLVKEQDYAATLIGKWHLGYGSRPWDETGVVMPPGMESWRLRADFGFEAPPALEENSDVFFEYTSDLARWVEENPHKEVGPITAQGIRFMEVNRDQPFLLILSHFTVHTKLEARKELVEKYCRRMEGMDEPPMNPVYAAMVEVLDESVGHVLTALDELGLEGNTLVMFFSDNGGQYSDNRSGFITTNGPLRGNKGMPYEGGIRVPLIARWPGVIEPGRVSDVPVQAEDVFFTLADVAGASLPDDLPRDGISFKPVLESPVSDFTRGSLHWFYPTGPTPFAVIRDGRYKLIELYEERRLELFDLEADQTESKNLAAERIDTTRALVGKLRDWMNEVGAHVPSFNPRYDPQRAGETPRSEFPWENEAGLKQTF